MNQKLTNLYKQLIIDNKLIDTGNINITGNWGVSALTPADRAIATSKNWVEIKQ